MKTITNKYLIVILSIILNSTLNWIPNITKPKIDILVILFSTVNYGPLSLPILFVLGLSNDVMNLTPTGLSSILYILTSLYSDYHRNKLIYSHLTGRFLVVFTLIIAISTTEYITNYLYSSSSILNISLIIEVVLTMFSYLLFAKKAVSSFQ